MSGEGIQRAPSPAYSKDDIVSGGTITLPHGTFAAMITTIAQLTAQNTELQAELMRRTATEPTIDKETDTEITKLREEVSRLATISTPISSSRDLQGGENVETTGDGSGAGSLENFQAVTKRNWHGKLGRAHMADVDRMPDTAKQELDCFLRRTIHAMFPVGGNYSAVKADIVFATLSTFGLRLEDRGSFADVTIFTDAERQEAPTITRLFNYSAFFYTYDNKFERYWRASAIETILELARYRGLFDTGGFMKQVD